MFAKGLPLAMIFAALTERQSGIVLGCLVFVVFLLVLGTFKTWRRLDDLEKAIYHSTKSTTSLKTEVKSMLEVDAKGGG